MKQFVILTILLISANSLWAQSMYVDDTLLVPLRAGEGTGFRIVHKGLPSGTKLEIIEQNVETGYSFVRTPGGLEGYLPTRYLSSEPIARLKLAKAESDLAAITSENTELKGKLNDIQKQFTTLEKEHQSTSSNLNSNSEELERIKAISADALNLDRRNRELRESNEQLRNELELVQVENIRLKDKSESNMMLMGGALVLLGVILAMLVPMLKPGKKNDSWA
jgi:SH3 domain protein